MAPLIPSFMVSAYFRVFFSTAGNFLHGWYSSPLLSPHGISFILFFKAFPCRLNFSQHGGLWVVPLLTWWLASKKHKMEATSSGRIGLKTGTTSFLLYSTGQSSHRACLDDSRGGDKDPISLWEQCQKLVAIFSPPQRESLNGSPAHLRQWDYWDIKKLHSYSLGPQFSVPTRVSSIVCVADRA